MAVAVLRTLAARRTDASLGSPPTVSSGAAAFGGAGALAVVAAVIFVSFMAWCWTHGGPFGVTPLFVWLGVAAIAGAIASLSATSTAVILLRARSGSSQS